MITFQDIKTPEYKYEVALSKLTGLAIKEVKGYIADPFSSGPLFEVSGIVLEDGTELLVSGEHEVAFIYAPGREPERLNMDEETLERLYRESREDE